MERLDYLLRRYNRATQQLIAWSGVLLKLLDIAALLSIGTGFLSFVIAKFILNVPLAAGIGAPVAMSFLTYVTTGLLTTSNATSNPPA